jgi:hypothetical protein
MYKEAVVVYHVTCLERLRKTSENLSQDGWYPGRDSKGVPLEYTKQNELRGLQCESELYRPSDRLLSAKLVPTFADKGVTWSAQRIPHGR